MLREATRPLPDEAPGGFADAPANVNESEEEANIALQTASQRQQALALNQRLGMSTRNWICKVTHQQFVGHGGGNGGAGDHDLARANERHQKPNSKQGCVFTLCIYPVLVGWDRI